MHDTLPVTVEARAAVSAIALLLAQRDLNAESLLRLAQEHRRLDYLLGQLVTLPEEDIPARHPLRLVSSRTVQRAARSHGQGSTYCHGCGFAFDTNNPIQAAQHRSH